MLEELRIDDLQSECSAITFSVPAKTPGKHIKQQTPLASQILTPQVHLTHNTSQSQCTEDDRLVEPKRL
jgi:hypothetical protein